MIIQAITRGKARLIAILVITLLIALIVAGVCWLNPKLTRFVESDRFRTELERETAKGLHLENAHYGAIHRTGTWTAETIDLDEVPMNEWLPRTWKEHVYGAMSGAVSWHGKNPKLETSNGNANLHVNNGSIRQLPFLEKIAAVTGQKDFERLDLDEFAIVLQWQYPKVDITHLSLEQKGRIHVEGEVFVDNRKLSGSIELGISPRLLGWLPNAREVFSREHDGYLWTTVQLSGTIDAPKQDLSPRIMEVIEESPAAGLRLLFRQFGEWFGKKFEND